MAMRFEMRFLRQEIAHENSKHVTSRTELQLESMLGTPTPPGMRSASVISLPNLNPRRSHTCSTVGDCHSEPLTLSAACRSARP
eukprot:364796-Chlamydomonas_euryale.AAC.1